jgi:hypothetical protein
MNNKLIIALICLGLVSPIIQAAVYTAKPGDFIETQLCGTGQLIRIPIGGPEDDAPQKNHQACHAICARDQDEEDSGPVA